MPRNVRNYWIDLQVDGRKTRIAAGPPGKHGGFSMTIKQRSDGCIITPVTVYGYSNPDGVLVLAVHGPDHKRTFTVQTNR